MLVFPQGTTWCTESGSGFRRALFQAAVDAEALGAAGDGQLPAGREPSTVAAFLGDDTFAASLHRRDQCPKPGGARHAASRSRTPRGTAVPSAAAAHAAIRDRRARASVNRTAARALFGGERSGPCGSGGSGRFRGVGGPLGSRGRRSCGGTGARPHHADGLRRKAHAPRGRPRKAVPARVTGATPSCVRGCGGNGPPRDTQPGADRGRGALRRLQGTLDRTGGAVVPAHEDTGDLDRPPEGMRRGHGGQRAGHLVAVEAAPARQSRCRTAARGAPARGVPPPHRPRRARPWSPRVSGPAARRSGAASLIGTVLVTWDAARRPR